MPIDQTKLGIVVQEQMAAIEADHQDEECVLGNVAVIVEVYSPESRDVRVRSDPPDRHVRIGLLAEALKGLLTGD
jgi:hypothetical protein